MTRTDNDVLDESVLKKLTNFADSQPKIVAVYRGVDPEEGGRTYYFINPQIKYDDQLTTAVGNLELNIYKTDNVNISLMSWPIALEDIPEGDFLGECIHKCPPKQN